MKHLFLALFLFPILPFTALNGQDFGSLENEEVIVKWSCVSGFQGTTEMWQLVFSYDEEAIRIQAYGFSDDPFGTGKLLYEIDATATDLLAWNGALDALQRNETNLIAQFATDRFLEISFEFIKKDGASYKEAFSVIGIGTFTSEFLERMDRSNRAK